MELLTAVLNYADQCFRQIVAIVMVQSMTLWRRRFLWTGLILSVPAGGYAAVATVFYAWLSAASPDRWPPERAGVWTAVALLATLLFFVLFVYCLASLIRDANRRYREEQSAKVMRQSN